MSKERTGEIARNMDTINNSLMIVRMKANADKNDDLVMLAVALGAVASLFGGIASDLNAIREALQNDR